MQRSLLCLITVILMSQTVDLRLMLCTSVLFTKEIILKSLKGIPLISRSTCMKAKCKIAILEIDFEVFFLCNRITRAHCFLFVLIIYLFILLHSFIYLLLFFFFECKRT